MTTKVRFFRDSRHFERAEGSSSRISHWVKFLNSIPQRKLVFKRVTARHSNNFSGLYENNDNVKVENLNAQKLAYNTTNGPSIEWSLTIESWKLE